LASSLSFARLSSGRGGEEDPGWIGKTKGVIAGERAHVGRVIASGQRRFRRAGRGMAIHVATSAWRTFVAIRPDIQATGGFRTLAGGVEGKYFTTSGEAAASYARQAVRAFNDPPYTIVRTQVPESVLLGPGISATVDRGIPGKFRSIDGKWQYRAKPGDLVDGHIDLEELNPVTGEVKQNLHLRWPTGESR
jgi:hypothetical protein